MLDADALLAWLDARTTSGGLITGAVYTGLAERIRRGDFNIQEGGDDVSHGSKSMTD